MSAFTYLYFAGGAVAIILGFFAVGIMQRAVFDGFRQFGLGGMVVVFGLLGALSNIDSAFDTLIVALVRLTPLLVLLQFVLLRRTPVSTKPALSAR